MLRLRKYEKVWESIKYEKVWESMLKIEKVWESMLKVADEKLGSTVIPLSI